MWKLLTEPNNSVETMLKKNNGFQTNLDNAMQYNWAVK